MPVELQHLECVCGQRWTENVVGNDEYIPVEIVEDMFRHFQRKLHKPVIKRYWWPFKPKKSLEMSIMDPEIEIQVGAYRERLRQMRLLYKAGEISRIQCILERLPIVTLIDEVIYFS